MCCQHSNKGLPQNSTHLLHDKLCVPGAQLKGATWESICNLKKTTQKKPREKKKTSRKPGGLAKLH